MSVSAKTPPALRLTATSCHHSAGASGDQGACPHPCRKIAPWTTAWEGLLPVLNRNRNRCVIVAYHVETVVFDANNKPATRHAPVLMTDTWRVKRCIIIIIIIIKQTIFSQRFDKPNLNFQKGFTRSQSSGHIRV